MAELKWIKLTTDIFDDEKILMIESLPSADTLIVIWFKLLTLAGKSNNNGVFMMNNRVPYTEDMLAAIFRRDLNSVKLALGTFEQFGMIEIIGDTITIPNWDKHQSLDAYEKKKERDRRLQAERRAKQKALVEKSSDNRLTTSDCQMTVAVSEEDKEKEIDIEKDNIILPSPAKPTKHKYGEYNNVLLSDDELEKLKTEYPDYAERIERLSSYVASTGKSYKSHYATIRNWARKDTVARPVYQKQTKAQELDEAYKMMAEWAEGS
jgi:predicted phage replisome organizer